MTPHVVIWDGRKGGPGGAQLYVEEPQHVPEPPPVPQRTVIRHTGTFDRVKKAIKTFGLDWFTSGEIRELTGLRPEQVATALYGLCQQGKLEKTITPRRYRVTGR